ncbi:MAG: peptide ABC transporter substrate-binding protein [Anaerolineae bacterium]|nr:peptide ABC transporter substrate-binding protein [Anaerolineae bacterium]
MQRLLPTMRRASLLAVLAILIGSLIVGGRTAPAAAAPLHQDTAALRLASPPLTSLDPVAVSRFDPDTRDLVENLFIGLTRFDPGTQQVEPMLAESWTVSDDGLTWTFTLRDDIQWVRYDSGTQTVTPIRPVAAGDFVYAIQRACDPLRPSPLTPNLMIVNGCQTVAQAFPEVINDLFIAREIGARATGPYTLEIDLLFPSAYFLTLTSTPEFRPLPREAVSAPSNWTAPGAIMTNGPYTLQNWTGAGMKLIRNPHWPDTYTGNVEQVDVTFTTDTMTASMLASGGRVDMARLSADEVAAARTTNRDLLRTAPGSSVVMLGFSYDRALVEVPEVRRALAYAIDREALVNQLFPDQALALSQFTPPGVVAAPQYNGLSLNPVQAQADYEMAGYPGCNNIPETLIMLVPDDDPAWIELGQAVIEQWSVNLGCHTALFEVRTLSRVLMIELAHLAYDPESVTRSHMWLVVWSGDYPDANAWLSDALHCRYGYIRPGRECDAGDALLDRAAVEPDIARRAELYAQAEEYFFGPDGTFPVLPLYVTTCAWLQQPWLTAVNDCGPARFDLWTIDTSTQPGA